MKIESTPKTYYLTVSNNIGSYSCDVGDFVSIEYCDEFKKKTIYKAEILKITERYITVGQKLISGIEPFETTIRIDTITEITKR